MNPALGSYDHVLVATSCGTDSVASLLWLLEQGVDPARIELHHHEVDGRGEPFMDWPSTAGYCRAIAAAFGLPIYYSWREGGLLREMLRDGQPTAAVLFETPAHGVRVIGGHGPLGTRLRFPQVSADLSVRWCSPVAKIGPMDTLIRNQDRFLGVRTLVVTGERAEESPARARYAAFEPHRSDTRTGTRCRRHVDHLRPVHGWSEREVWSALRRHGIVPAPAYRLQWSRLSCFTCVFGSPSQWATVRAIAPAWFERIARYEDQFGCTIQRGRSVRDMADRGAPFPADLAQPALVEAALTPGWDEPVRIAPGTGRPRQERSVRQRGRSEQSRTERRCRPASHRARVGPGACGALARRAAGRRGGRGFHQHKGNPRCPPPSLGWTGTTRLFRSSAPSGTKATPRPTSAAVWA